MNSNRNCTIDLLRLFFAIQVVALHTNPFLEYSKMGSYVFSQTISRLAVPFFSTVAGYYFFKRKKTGTLTFKKSILKYFNIYAFWSIIMFIYEGIRWKDSAIKFALYVFKTFFFEGWRHLWYLLAIIYTIVILMVAYSITKKAINVLYYFSFVLLAIGIAIYSYGNLFIHSPLQWVSQTVGQSMIGGLLFIVIPFFLLGYSLNEISTETRSKYSLRLVFICIVGLLGEILLTTIFHLHKNVTLCLFTYPTIYCLMNWSICNPYPDLLPLANDCSLIASTIYFTHALFADYFRSLKCTETITFLLCILVTSIIGWILAKTDHSIVHKIIQ